MEILVRAVGPQACRTGAQVEAHEWGELMARKRRGGRGWGSRSSNTCSLIGGHWTPRPPVRPHRDSQRRDRSPAYGSVHDAGIRPTYGEVARTTNKRVLDQGAEHTNLDSPMEAWLRAV